jgi:hypothetical protein
MLEVVKSVARSMSWKVVWLCIGCLEMGWHDAIVGFGRDARGVANQQHSGGWKTPLGS